MGHPEFLYMSDFDYLSHSNTLHHLPTGNNYSDYYGVSKISTFQQDKIQTSLNKTYGYKRAEEIKRKSVLRGNHLHKVVRLNSLDADLGESLGKEIFVYGELLINQPAVQGSIDEITYDPKIGYTLIEYKSKSSMGAWKKYEKTLMPNYLRKLAVYRFLLWDLYNVDVKRVCIILLFPQMKHLVINIDLEDLRPAFNEFEFLYQKFLNKQTYL